MKNTQEMNRTELIYTLARYAQPSWYHSILDWNDAQLRSLLTYYQSGGDYPTGAVGKTYRTPGVGWQPPTEKPMIVVVIEDDRGNRLMKKIPASKGGVVLIPKGYVLKEIRDVLLN